MASTDHPYHMRSYILENGAALDRTLRQSEASLQAVAAEAHARGCARIVLSGVGSSYTAASAAKLAFDDLVREPTYVIPTTELRYHGALLDEQTLVVVLSRSGERRRVLDGLSVAEESGAFTVAVTGAADSLMAQIAARTVLTAEGPEISFTKTKSVTAGIGVFLSLALALSNRDIDDLTGLRAALGRLPAAIDQTLDRAAPDVERLAGRLGCDRVIIAGTGPNAGVAMELALTLQESALVAAQWSDTGNLLHGPLCPLDENWLVALLVTPDDLQLSADTFRVVQALGARTLAVAPSDMTIEPAPDDTLRLTELPERILWPLLYLPILQLLTYHWTVARGLNPDSPSGSELMLNAMLPPGRAEPEARMAE